MATPLSTVFSLNPMMMTEYQNKMIQQPKQNDTSNTTPQGPVEGEPGGEPDGGLSFDNCPLGDKTILDSGNMKTMYTIGQMQMTDYQNAKAIAEQTPNMDMNDYLELKDNKPAGGGGGLVSTFSTAQMHMVDYQNAESLYRMADSDLLDKAALQEMLDSGEFEGTVYAKVAEQILNGDTEGLEAWNFKDAGEEINAPDYDGTQVPGSLGSVFSVAKMQMVDYQHAQDLDKLARNGLIDFDALQERYDNGDLNVLSNATAAHILGAEEG